MTKRQLKQETKSRRAMQFEIARIKTALADLVDAAGGYGIATADQIATVADKHEVERHILEGEYVYATETAGEQ